MPSDDLIGKGEAYNDKGFAATVSTDHSQVNQISNYAFTFFN